MPDELTADCDPVPDSGKDICVERAFDAVGEDGDAGGSLDPHDSGGLERRIIEFVEKSQDAVGPPEGGERARNKARHQEDSSKEWPAPGASGNQRGASSGRGTRAAAADRRFPDTVIGRSSSPRVPLLTTP
jgi:hypothetical protein